ncbi:MAG: hypothetical protein AABM29_03610 [Actinomycetota bacterium]
MALVAGTLALLTLGLSACGGGGSRQDVDEPEGDFPVEITTSQFPTRQRLAETSFLQLGVQNTGDKAIPGVAITISLDENAIRPFSVRDPQPNLAAPDRPVWVLENQYPKLVGETASAGALTANEKTFSFGSLAPGDTVEAVWKVTPVRSGSYTLDYQVDAGLSGKAKAVTADGSPPTGSFVVQISSEPPQTRVNDAGEVEVIPGQGGGGGGSSSNGASGSGNSGGGLKAIPAG